MPEPDLSKETINGQACPKSFVIRTRNMGVRMKIGTFEEKRQAEEISLSLNISPLFADSGYQQHSGIILACSRSSDSECGAKSESEKKCSYLFTPLPHSGVELSKESCSVKYFFEVFVDLVEV